MIDIDPGSLIVSLVFLAAFVTPFIYQKNKIKKIEILQNQLFEKLVVENRLQLDSREHWRGTYQIGIDSKNKWLVYQRYGEDSLEILIDLSSIAKASINERSQQKVIGKEKHLLIDYIAITLHPKDRKDPDFSLEIYDGDRFIDLLGERVLANNWIATIEKVLNH